MSQHRRITATLVTRGPLRVGGGSPDERSELPVQRDLADRPRVPGSSLAGALRAAAARRLPDRVEHLFGSDQPHGAGEGVDGVALEPSRVQVGDARVRAPAAAGDAASAPAGELDGVTTEVRPRVGVDRERLSAKPNVLFDAESWPVGLRLSVPLTCPSEDVGDALAALEALAAPDGGIGSGPCPVELEDWTVETVEDRAVSMLEAALARGRGQTPASAPAAAPVSPSAAVPAEDHRRGGWLRLDLAVELIEPLACRLPLDPALQGQHDGGGKLPDNLPFPLATVDADHGMAWTVGLPASALKGVLRQRAERACAYLAGAPLPDPWSAHRENPVTRLFGWASQDRHHPSAAARLRCSDLRHDHVVSEPATLPDSDTQLRGPAAVLAHPACEARERVRIDRLTGSVLGSALFTDACVREGEQLTGSVTLVDDGSRRAADPPAGVPVDRRDLALLAVALRDLAEGLVGVGGSTRSGYGTVRPVELTLQWGAPGEPARERTATDPGERERDRRRDIPVRPDGGITWPDDLADEIRQGWQTVRTELTEAHASEVEGAT